MPSSSWNCKQPVTLSATTKHTSRWNFTVGITQKQKCLNRLRNTMNVHRLCAVINVAQVFNSVILLYTRRFIICYHIIHPSSQQPLKAYCAISLQSDAENTKEQRRKMTDGRTYYLPGKVPTVAHLEWMSDHFYCSVLASSCKLDATFFFSLNQEGASYKSRWGNQPHDG